MRPANSVGSPGAETAGVHVVPAATSFKAGAGVGAGLLVGGYYRVGERIGAGGEGESFRAVDERSGETCALKLFRASATPASVSRVQSEFQRLRALSHPGVVRARDLGRHEGRLYLVTELLTGPTLTTLAALEDAAERRALWGRAARELADALAYLHGNGVVHGDVSPENVRIAGDGRAVLIDFAPLGLATTGGAVGTLGFAAPEALIGRLTAASDLFAYGATLFRAWTGRAPFGEGGAAVARMLADPAPGLSLLRPGLSPGWDDLIASLLQREPERRPAFARVVLRTIARLTADDTNGAEGIQETTLEPPYPAGDPLAGTFVGRAEPRAMLQATFERLGEASCAHAVIAIVGPEGSGRRSLIDVALRDLAVAQLSDRAAPVAVFRGALSGLLSWLGMGPGAVAEDDADEPIRARQRLFARAVAALEIRGRATPVLVVLGAAPADHEFATFVAGAPASGQWLTLLPVARPLGQVSALEISLAPLDAHAIAELVTRATGEAVPQSAVDRLVRASAGHAATVCVLARQLVQAFREGTVERFEPTPDLALDQMLTRTFAQLSPEARRLVAHVALRSDSPDTEHPDPDGVSFSPSPDREAAARAAGWLVGEASTAALPSVVHLMVVRRALADPDLQEVARGVLAHAGGSRGATARALCLEALGRPDEAAQEFLAAAAAVRDRDARAGSGSANEDAATWLEEAARLAPRLLNTAETLFLINALAWQGRTEAALALVTRALGAAAPSGESSAGEADAWAVQLRLVERRAWLLTRAGLLTTARDILESVLAPTDARWAAGEHMEIDRAASRARARLARVLVSLGCFDRVLRVALPVPDEPVAAALSVESAVLALAYRGELLAARRLHDEQRTCLAPARAAYLEALLDQLAGALLSALDRYQRALAAAESVADIHTVAAIALNMGALAAEAGRFDQALLMQERAIRELGRLGATSELEVALFNAGMLLIDLGELSGARGIVNRLRHEGAGKASLSIAAVSYLEAELAVRDGDVARALTLFASASEAAGLDAAVGQAARLARAELLARALRADEARALLDEWPSAHAGGRAGVEVQLSRARVLLAGGTIETEVASTLAVALWTDAEDAAREGRRPRAWRAALTAARLFHRAGKTADAVAAAARAKQLFEEVRMSTPIDHRAGLERDADAQFLADLSRLAGSGAEAADPTRAVRGSRAEDRLRRLLRINKRLNSELRLPRLLELIMDTVIELTEAERGFILLDDEKGELAVKVARNIDQQTLDTDAFNISRSIASQAALGGAPIVTIDAAGDPRFREALSVSDLHLRSVLAVPLQVKGRAVGTLYVDNRLRKGAFSDDDVQLVLDFAEQAGIAIENARLLGEVRRRERQIEVLNRRLQSELAVRKEELVGMKQELRENRDALAIRYDYRNIVGRTPRMLDLFRLLDRLTDTALPVVIQGESGTGKELVARALHFNGPRRERPFVSENCAAIPETLLEATLFGSVRGAYTGADHDSRGLFEVADGGTLFLDEVGEMSAAMQGKLLRVLQSGELRRVGSERTRKVEVRVIAATNRDLARMVEEGRFRQDLFFRLSVAAIMLPPLRDRRDDIPAIVEHVLERLGQANNNDNKAARARSGSVDIARRRVTPAALARLCAYRWPGNVRELENELMRAAAMSDGQIDVGDLSPAIAGNGEAALTTLDNPDDLSLRPRVERLERALLREALSRCGGNQTRAAVALGLSRFGLQKKLHRYQMG